VAGRLRTPWIPSKQISSAALGIVKSEWTASDAIDIRG